MKTLTLILIHLAGAIMLFAGSCSHTGTNDPKLKGKWRSKDGTTDLEITGNKFIESSAELSEPVSEDYFMKGDSIFTSFEGNQPYTKFVIQKIDEHNLVLLYPDSVLVEFVK